MTETENVYGEPVMRYTYEDNPVGDVPLAEKASIVDAIFGGGNTEKETRKKRKMKEVRLPDRKPLRRRTGAG